MRIHVSDGIEFTDLGRGTSHHPFPPELCDVGLSVTTLFWAQLMQLTLVIGRS